MEHAVPTEKSDFQMITEGVGLWVHNARSSATILTFSLILSFACQRRTLNYDDMGQKMT